jgi:SsrA-binding protein
LSGKLIKKNKYAKFNYNVDKEYEAGIVLKGLDVKAIRANKFEIREAFVRVENDELYLWNIIFSDQQQDNTIQKRKLLLHKKEIAKIITVLKDKKQHGFVLSIRYNEKNKVKVDIALGTTKKKFDKKGDQKRSTDKRTLEKDLKSNYGM